MRLTNYGEDFLADAIHAELDQYEHATIVLPSGHRVDVFDDHIRVAEPGTHRTTDGAVIWKTKRGG